MADVYKAVDEVLGRTVAVKVMHARLAADPSFAARFRQEAQAAANLMSPNIVNMYDWGQDDDTFYIVMEYVRGTDLKSIIEREGALPSRTVAEIGAQVCSALSVAHGYDVIHRDVKPHNIMVQPDGAVKVMDFGIARAGTSMMTQTGSVLGTAQYLSPEAALGTPLTAASDLYSLGIVLYEAATGRVPFDGDTPVAVALKQVNEQAVPPHRANPDIDPALDAVIVKAMQKKTIDRYVSADDLRRDLCAVAQGRPIDTAAGYAGVVADVPSAGMTSRVGETAVMPRVSGSDLRGHDERPEPRAVPKRRAVWPWIVLAVLLVIAGLGVAWSAGLRDSQGTPVPEVRAMTRADAETALRDAGFTVGDVKEAFSESVKSGTVVSQSPEPNATARRGSAVDLVLSKGPEMVAVPNVVDMLEADAFETLQRAGFSPQASPSQFNSDVPANTVYEQTPSGDETAPKGSIVSYVVSRGPDPGVRGQGDKPGKSKDGDGHP
jgi:serine/threonine-protein kinase